MLSVFVVLLLALVLSLLAWAFARETNLPRWGALAAAGTTFIAVSGLGMTVLAYLSSFTPS
jgi:FtsH-binding integral membrane protein